MVLTKREMWGLLCKPRTDEGRWHWVMDARYIFNTREEAFEQATEWNISDSGYVYKPVRVEATAEYEK